MKSKEQVAAVGSWGSQHRAGLGGRRDTRLAAAVIGAAFALVPGSGAVADTLYWDGTGTAWEVAANWSTVQTAAAPDPAAPPGSMDLTTFVASTALAAQTVNLNADQAALGLVANASNTFTTTLVGGGTARTLSLGTSGISQVGGGFVVGSTTAGQEVSISLQGAQTWTGSTAAASPAGLQILNGVSIGAGGNQTLTLGGTNALSAVGGAVADGSAVLSLAKTGTGTWTLSGPNSYTGATNVGAGGALNVQSNTALGTAAAGTTVASTGAVQLQGGVTVTGEALSLVGDGTNGTTAPGALRNISGNNIWTGNLAVGTGATTRLNSEAGLLTVSGNVALSPTTTDQFVLQGNGNGLISGVISGASRVTRSTTGTGTWTLSGANTFTGTVQVTGGFLSVGSLNKIVGGSASSNLGAPATAAAGVISLGGTGSSGTLVYTGTGETTDRTVNLAGTTGGGTIDQSGTGLLKFTTNLTAGAGTTGDQRKTLTLQGSAAGTGEFAGIIADSPAGAAGQLATAVTKSGTGAWTLSAANTYTGTTTLTAGRLLVANAASLGGTTAGTVVNSGAQVELANGLTVAGETISLNGPGTGTGTGANRGALQAAAGATATWAGPVTVASNTGRVGAQANGTLTISGAIGDASANRGLLVSAEGGTGVVVLSGANTYGGTTGIIRGTLRLGAAGSVPAATVLDVHSALGVTDPAAFD
ncbi:MAG: hypothetical protein JWO31_2291, partial [Phycisphaerales bacterium]|nr:hypothetical protein [Phycisphaerales bacterium]